MMWVCCCGWGPFCPWSMCVFLSITVVAKNCTSIFWHVGTSVVGMPARQSRRLGEESSLFLVSSFNVFFSTGYPMPFFGTNSTSVPVCVFCMGPCVWVAGATVDPVLLGDGKVSIGSVGEFFIGEFFIGAGDEVLWARMLTGLSSVTGHRRTDGYQK